MRSLCLCLVVLASCAGSSSSSSSFTEEGTDRTTTSAPIDEPAPPAATASTASAPPSPSPAAPPPVTLRRHRDRLLDSLAGTGKTRCALWAELTATQRGVFLTITDLLGQRSLLFGASALDHVTKVYAIRDSNGDNGGMNNNRIWLQVDALLIDALRHPDSPALPEWRKSTDFAGPHAPFDADSETVNGQPRGQAHFWSADAKSKPVGRPGVETIDDPHIVEIDIDYDLFHNSNPEGTYFPNGKGRDHYAKVWSSKGTAASPELDYTPTCN